MRTEIPLTNPKSNKQFGSLSVFTSGGKAYVYAERWNKDHTSKYTGLLEVNDENAGKRLAESIVKSVQAGGFFKISREAHQTLVAYREAKAARKNSGGSNFTARGNSPNVTF